MANNLDAEALAVRSAYPKNRIMLDDKGLPSVMVFIPKFQLYEVMSGGVVETHPAFIVNGKEIDGFWIGKYETKHINGRAYSLPGEAPSYEPGMAEFENYAEAKGKGWHEVTAAEWAAVALWCHRHNCEPAGNGYATSDTTRCIGEAVPVSYISGGAIGRVATGTGPLIWSHNGKPDGIWDMSGNVYEWGSGIRFVYGELQVLENNNAADSRNDKSSSSANWKAIRGSDGAYITPDGSGTTDGSIKMNWSGSAVQWNTTVAKGMRSCLFKNITCSATNIGTAAKRKLVALGLMPDKGLDATSGVDDTYGDTQITWNGYDGDVPLLYGGGYKLQYRHIFNTYAMSRNVNSANDVGGRVAYVELPD